MTNKEVTAYAGLSLMTLITGLSFIFVKIGLAYANPYDLLAHRFTVAFLTVVALLAAGVIRIPKIAPRDRISILGISLFYPLLFFALQALGMQYSTASEAGVIFAFLPVFMLVAGWLFLKERTTFLAEIRSGAVGFGAYFYLLA